MTLPPHPLINFEIQEYYQNEPRFNGAFSRDNLDSAVKNGAYVINLDEYHDIGTHWVALYVYNKTVTYFDSFGVEHIPKEIMKFIAHKKIITNIYRIQAYDSIMCGYFCIGFINFMFNGKIPTVVGISAGIAGASLTLIFTVTTDVVKTLLNITKKKKKKHNKIIALARSKLNIIENLISPALIDFEITHKEFSKIIYEKNNYEQIIDNIRSVKSINDLNKENYLNKQVL